MPVVWRYERPPAPDAGHVSIIWPVRILVQIDPAARADAGLRVHEQVHVDQFQRLRPLQFVHAWRYRLDAEYRYRSELEGYLAQLPYCADRYRCAIRFSQRLAKIRDPGQT